MSHNLSLESIDALVENELNGSLICFEEAPVKKDISSTSLEGISCLKAFPLFR